MVASKMIDRKSIGRRRMSTMIFGALEKATTNQSTQQQTRLADALLAAGGAAGSLAFLQFLQDFFFANTPITGGFLIGSAIKFFLNRNPPSLEAFWKSTAFSIGIGSVLHSILWTLDENGEATMTISKQYSVYLMTFIMILYWKLDAGTIWGAGKSLASFIAYGSGFWGQTAAQNRDFKIFVADFPTWYVLGPYLLGHSYLYLCAMGLSHIRRRVRIYLLRKDVLTSPHANNEQFIGPTSDRGKLRILFDRIDTSGDGRLDAMELMLAIRASTGDEVSLEYCRDMIGTVDTDGDGTLDFNEFCEAVDHLLLVKK